MPEPSAAATAEILAFGEFVLDLRAQRLLRAGQPVAVPPRYFAVLVHLAGSGGRLVGKDELLDAVWGHRSVSDSALKVAINALRTVLGDEPKAPRFVETVARRGYRFIGMRPGPAVAAATAASAPATAAACLGNLPAPASGLLGRDAELARLHAALGQHRLVSLLGPGGVGKTRLALAAAGHAAPRDGVWLLRLDALADAAPLLATVARLLALGPGADASEAALARTLSGLQLRLLLDNAEHLRVAVAALADALLAGAPGVQLLVTSQVPLCLAGEHRLTLSPLALPQADDDPAQAPAVALLVQRVRQQQPELPLSPADLADAAAIGHCLDGLPLALELAASRVPLLGWAGVRQRLQADLAERLSLLSRGPAAAPERHRTLRAALAWAVDLLEPVERRALQALSVFAGSFSLASALALIDDPAGLDLLDSLRERSLIHRAGDGAPLRWRLFDSVRAHAGEGLQASGEEAAVLQRFIAVMTRLFEQADVDWSDLPLLPWLARLQPDNDNLRAAMQRALADPALHGAALDLFSASVHYRVRAGWRLEAQGDHAALLALQLPAAPGLQQAHFELAQAMLAVYAQVLAPQPAALAAQRAAAAFSEAGEDLLAHRALVTQAALLMRLQAPLAERAELLARARSLEPAHWGAMQRRQRHWHDVMLQRDRGELEAFGRECGQLLTQSEAMGDLFGAWNAAMALAQVRFGQGQLQQAVELLGPVVAQMRSAGLLRENAHVLAQWAGLRVMQAAAPDAVAALHEAARMLQAEGRLWWAADLLVWVPAGQGRVEAAVQVQAWADALVRARGDQRGPLFGPVRRRFDGWLAARPGEHAAALARPPALDEAGVLYLVFAQAVAATT